MKLGPLRRSIVCYLIFASVSCVMAQPQFATANLGDGSDLKFRIEVHTIETEHLSTLTGTLIVDLVGDASFVLWVPTANAEGVVYKWVKRNLLGELRNLEFELNKEHCENPVERIKFYGPVDLGRYATCDPQVIARWIAEL